MKLDVAPLRYLQKEHFDVLTAIEMGSRNHEVVPMRLLSQLSKQRPGGVNKLVSDLQKLKLVSKESGKAGSGKPYEGVILGYGGYDYLALRALSGKGAVVGVGRQIGVGKESDIYEVFPGEDIDFSCVIKLQRLGRTSFRSVKKNRDYIGNRQHYSWLYLSKLAATKEFAFIEALYEHGFPVPVPVGHSRHVICMQQIMGIRLDELRLETVPGETEEAKLEFVKEKLTECIRMIIRLAEHGLVHGDFNEFNLILEEDSLRMVMIDFPQMTSVKHEEASVFFQRDVEGVISFFARKFGVVYEGPMPELSSIIQSHDLDRQLRASGSKSKDLEDLEDLDDEDLECEDNNAEYDDQSGSENHSTEMSDESESENQENNL